MVNLMAKRILLIVEGESDEVKFLKQLFKKCYSSIEYEFVPYRSNIHVLAQELYNNYPDFEEDNIDIKLILQSLIEDEHRKAVLQEKYTDIYMIFDFEPQHDTPHFDTLRRMLEYFNDSTYQGKLYINYPMMQSYKHFAELPDKHFYDKIVNFEDVSGYKKLVGEESNFTDITKYNYNIFFSLTVHHIKKVFYILTNMYELPTEEQYISMDLVSLFDKQLELLKTSNKIWVVNTCIFAISDFAPKKFFYFVVKHSDELLI